MKIRIANKKHGARGWYVGRPSPLGNPFPMRDESERMQVIAQYREWLNAKIAAKDAAVMKELEAMTHVADLTLVCWCAPLPCHAEVIRDALLKMTETK